MRRAGRRSRRSPCGRGWSRPGSTPTAELSAAAAPGPSGPRDAYPNGGVVSHPVAGRLPHLDTSDALLQERRSRRGLPHHDRPRGCINCGVCMDVCPVQALDMTRPRAAGCRGRRRLDAPPNAWMMEYPVQVGECIGCSVCIQECPVQVMTLDHVPGATLAACPARVPITAPSPPRPGWVPFSEVTLESLKPNHPEPFEPEYRWRFADRSRPWSIWSEPGAAGRDARGALPDGVPGRHRRRSVRGPHRRGSVRRRLRGGRRGQPLPIGLRLDLHRARARPPAAAARSTSRSRSARSSASRQSVGTAAGRLGPDGEDAPSGWPSSVAVRPACPPPTTSRGSATR